MVGDVPPGQNFKYSAQKNETDLGYLQRLASENNAVFTVKGDQLIFHDIAKLESAKPVLIINKSDVSNYSFSDKIIESAVKAVYFDPDTEENIESEEEHEGGGADKVKTRAPVESKAQQGKKTQAAAGKSKKKEKSGAITLEGNIKLVAGCNVDLQGFGVFDGLAQIVQAKHKIDGGGYKIKLELKY